MLLFYGGILEENHILGAVSGLIDALEFYRTEHEIKHYIDRLDNFENKKREDINSSGYVVDTLEAALWCLFNTNSYKDCVLLAVNLGDDTDTIAAIAGSLAGALYGYIVHFLKTLKKSLFLKKKTKLFGNAVIVDIL